MTTPATLLVIGVHREELDFGRRVARSVDPAHVSVLSIPEGLSGRRPLPDEEFRYSVLHKELYRQILRHAVRSGCRLLVDLHAGADESGPSADVICADVRVRERLRRSIIAAQLPGRIRLVPLGGGAQTHASTVIPRELWTNPAFHYVGLEIYLPTPELGRAAGRQLAQQLIELLALEAVERWADRSSSQHAPLLRD